MDVSETRRISKRCDVGLTKSFPLRLVQQGVLSGGYGVSLR